MRALVAISDAGGFSAGARRLGLSSSAATRLVASLEHSLGVQLLHRSTRSVRLTRAGESRSAARPRDAARGRGGRARGESRATGAVGHAARRRAGPVRPAPRGPHPCAIYGLAPRRQGRAVPVERFRSSHRGGGRRRDPYRRPPISGLITRGLGHTRQLFAASPAYLADRVAPAVPAELRSHRLIAYPSVTPRRAWRFLVDGSPTTLAVDPGFFSDSGEAAIAIAASGGGILPALHYQIAPQLRSGELVEVLARFAPAPAPIQAVLPGTRFVSPPVRALLDLLAQERSSWEE